MRHSDWEVTECDECYRLLKELKDGKEGASEGGPWKHRTVEIVELTYSDTRMRLRWRDPHPLEKVLPDDCCDDFASWGHMLCYLRGAYDVLSGN